MRTLLLAVFAALSLAAFAERELTLGEYTEEARRTIEDRVKRALAASNSEGTVSGTVTFSGDESFFIQAESDGLKVVFGKRFSGDSPAPGDVVEVTGGPSLEGGRVVFSAISCRKVGSAELPAAKLVTSDDLVYAGNRKSVNWQRVEISGRAIGRTENGFAINVNDLPVNVFCSELPDFLGDCDRMRPKVVVRGVAEMMLDQSVLFDRSRYVMGVKIDVSSAADITLVEDIVYLSNRRDFRVTVLVVFAYVVLGAGLFVLAWFFFRQRRRLFRSRTIMQERKRMADDIHDTIEQHLVGAGMLIKIGRLKEAEDVLVRAKREIRDIVWGLKNDDMMRQSPSEMLRELAHDETKKGICRVEARLVNGLPDHLEASKMRDLSLIVREAIGNAIKHGGAKKVAIACDPTPSGWKLYLSNDGATFDPSSAPGPKDGHFGIEGMRQRALRLGATVTIENRDGRMVMILEKKK